MYGCNISGLAFVRGMLVRSDNRWLYWDIIRQTKNCSVWSAFVSVLPLWWWPAHLSRDNSGGSATPTLGPADPTGRPTQGQWLLGPTFSNGYLTVVACLSLGAHDEFSLNRGRERGEEFSCSHTHSHSLSHILARVSFGFWLKFDCKNTLSLSHFFAVRLITYLEEQLLGKSFIFILLT